MPADTMSPGTAEPQECEREVVSSAMPESTSGHPSLTSSAVAARRFPGSETAA
jgi:hypothetical protein